jgi:two-component system, chemotaxis family, protein-glutamate methylesterase/glutaminase
MRVYDIIAVGASSGGVGALRRVVSHFPRDLPASVFVVLHVSPAGRSLLPEILAKAGPLRARHPENGWPVERHCIYIAPPGYDLTVLNGRILLGRGAPGSQHHPAVNALFRSVAGEFGARVVGVVLSGSLEDGAAGLVAIKQRGGLAIVEDPATAQYRGMPDSALASVNADFVLPLEEIGPKLVALATGGMCG